MEYQVIKQEPAPLEVLNKAQNQVLLESLSRNPKNRPVSAVDFIERLKAAAFETADTVVVEPAVVAEEVIEEEVVKEEIAIDEVERPAATESRESLGFPLLNDGASEVTKGQSHE